MNPLEQRVAQLERKLAEYEQFIGFEGGRVILKYPTLVRGPLSINGITIYTGNDSPNSVISANTGSLYLDLTGGSGTTLYVKESGTSSTGWSSTA